MERFRPQAGRLVLFIGVNAQNLNQNMAPNHFAGWKPCDLPEAVHAMELLSLNHENMPAFEMAARNDIKRLGALFATSAVNGHV